MADIIDVKPFTVILSEADGLASDVTCFHVVATDANAAAIIAMRDLYDAQHTGWTDDDLQDDPFSLAMFDVLYIFPGHLNGEVRGYRDDLL